MWKCKERIEEWVIQSGITPSEKRIIGLVGILSIVLAVMIQVVDNMPIDGSLFRNTYGGGDKQEIVQVEISGEKPIELEIAVKERVYSDEELQRAFEKGIAFLDSEILGSNESLDHVEKNLNLIEEIEGTALEVEWSWSPREVLNNYGEIQEEYVEEEGTLVELTGTLVYGEQEAKYCQTIQVFPADLEEEEATIMQLLQSIEDVDEQQKSLETLTLPSVLDEESLEWYYVKSYRGFVVLVMGLVVIILLFWRKKEEKRQELLHREEQMMRDYSQIISVFALYVGAGMTVKNAWKRLVEEYIIREDGTSRRYAYEELKRTYYEMMNGILEYDCYEQFGKRCGLRSYQRFALLLSQNVRKGTKGLTLVLGQEVREALEDRRNRIRQEAEKAGTKLLMPMFLMLAVVLIIIVVPAFLSIQI